MRWYEAAVYTTTLPTSRPWTLYIILILTQFVLVTRTKEFIMVGDALERRLLLSGIWNGNKFVDVEYHKDVTMLLLQFKKKLLWTNICRR